MLGIFGNINIKSWKFVISYLITTVYNRGARVFISSSRVGRKIFKIFIMNFSRGCSVARLCDFVEL